MRIRISPLDTLFFRDGKPFSMGEESWADGIFPPYPSVIYGAIRTWYLANGANGLSKSAIEESEGIKITGLHYQLKEGLYLPMPLDLVAVKDPADKQREEREKTYRTVRLVLNEQTTLSSHPLPALLYYPDSLEAESLEEGLIDHNSFKQYLEGALKEALVLKISDVALPEPKVGIGRDDGSNSTDESKLYRVGMRRSINFDFIVELTLPNGGFEEATTFIKLGGEGKAAAFEEKQGKLGSIKIEKNTIALKQGEFKLYLATPAVFNNNDRGAWEPNLERLGIKATLIAAALGKPQYIGGFDMAKKFPKPMLKAVPAGSVYYYRTEEPAEKVLEKLQGESVSDFMKEQGFGIAYVGNF